jgi:hypothetical protein
MFAKKKEAGTEKCDAKFEGCECQLPAGHRGIRHQDMRNGWQKWTSAGAARVAADEKAQEEKKISE